MKLTWETTTIQIDFDFQIDFQIDFQVGFEVGQ